MEGTQKFDMIVIGGGSGAMGAGRKAAQLGNKVAMIENKVIGGTCVNVGCVPKKVMLNLAGYLESAKLMADYGVKGAEGLSLDFPAFKERRDGYIKRLNGIYEKNIANDGLTYFTGTASFQDAKTVVTSEGATLTADHICIASGSYPKVPQFPGGELCWSSDDIFSMEELPKSMVTLGGGYIGVEMSQIMAALGVKTTLLARSKILRGMTDAELIPILQENMAKLHLDCRLNSPFTSVEKLDNGLLRVNLADGTFVDAEKVLSALGRPPAVDDLNLGNAGVEVVKGAVKVDEWQNTNVEGIYAIGDVTAQISLTPVAIRQGRLLSQRLFKGE